MTAPLERSAIVIGAGIGGLAAAAYLARAGVRTTLFESRAIVGGASETAMLGESFRVPLAAHTCYALDRAMVRDLSLAKHGLIYANRAMPLVALQKSGRHLVLARDAFGSRAAIAREARADADAWLRYRRELFSFARALRPLFTGERAHAAADSDDRIARAAQTCNLSRKQTERLEALARISACAWLDEWFESEALKTALAFDVCLQGVSPYETGSSLLLAWRAAQQTARLRGATAQVKGGPLTLAVALTAAAQEAGALVRTGHRVTRILVEKGRVAGVGLAGGDSIHAAAVVSNLDCAATLALLPPDALPLGVDPPPPAPAVATAKIMLGLNGALPIVGLDRRTERARLVVAERPEAYAAAKGAALAGRIPDNLVMEIAVPSAADPAAAPVGHSVVSILLPFMPAEVDGGWSEAGHKLQKRVVAALEPYGPGIADRIVESCVVTPADFVTRYENPHDDPHFLARLLASADSRVRTPMPGLFVCGASAEAADAISGAAGRLAARLVAAELPEQNGVKHEPD